jgi:hypothetical protein
MYRVHNFLTTPTDDTKVWRYLDLAHFLWLLRSRTLYFASALEFEDEWEGVLPTGAIIGLKRAFGQVLGIEQPARAIGMPPPADSFMLRLFKNVLRSGQRVYGINCWHRNDVESVAMWQLYTRGNDGVAIQTRVERLKTCLSREPRDVYIANVKYLDHEAEPAEEHISEDVLFPLTTKRRSFAHESEVRLILDRRYKRFDQDEEAKLESSLRGETTPIDLNVLIERIVASPDYPDWALASLQDTVAEAGLSVQVEKSDLLRRPELPETPHMGHADEDPDSD